MSFAIKFIFAFFATTVCAQLVKLKCGDVSEFVDIHNRFRLELARGEVPKQPKAANMKEMTWDDELAAKAQKYALRGKFEHNPDKTIPSGRFTTGENLYMSSSTDPKIKLNATSAVLAWFLEHHIYKYDKISIVNFHGIGHYTQIVWANTTYVGCGVSKKTSNGWTSLLYVCNYGPPGNYIGQYPYKIGKGCENLCTSEGSSILYGRKCSANRTLTT